MNIYADHAATTKMSRRAIEVMLPYMDQIYGNPSSLQTATFCGQQGRIFRPVRAILSGQF